ncbi:Csa1 family protein [Staphylococcus pettenkoferi]|uniref:Csa1 family protein n=1 Tax=Staphylococcus pettenkoferi TaxID=170573 RepID=UPI0022741CCA|nr:Csa1 family protein [Staphylococcus pettenkoferi]MCY1605109.1 tandem-type lipoprotein [Staphylococcus pettenkoferi]
MNKKLKLTIVFISLFLLLCTSGCNKSTSYGHDKQIKKNIYDSLGIYPQKNLEDFYDIQGTKNRDFEKGDKGKWILNSSIKKKKNNILKSEGAVLYIDRNKRKATGYYYIKKFSDSGKNDINKYPVKLRKNNLVPTKKDINENICNKIKKFKFMVQYSDIKSDIHNKKGKYYYNYNSPKFIGSYKVTNNDDIIKKIKNI